MGRPKPTIEWRGERLADRAARVLETACDPVLEVGPGYTRLPAVAEDDPGAGPLTALDAGLRALDAAGAGGRPVVLLACDLPFVRAGLVALLAEWPGDGTVVPLADGHPQVLCARYGTDAIAAVGRLVASGTRSLRALVETVEPAFVGEDQWRAAGVVHAFADVDTPADLVRWSAAEG
jgi:molybdopterin-guanine dinucleotide biosynthesis protein A